MQRLAFVRGDWHLRIYCCQRSLTLDGTELARDQSDDITMNRALAVLNGQILTAATIEPGGLTRFCFDLGCILTTYPAPPGIYENEPAGQWKWYTGTGPVLLMRGDGSYSVSGPHEKPDDHQWLPITAPVHVADAG